MIAEFVQIVGLLSAYETGRQLSDVRGIASFLEWLTEHNHNEVRDVIEQNQVTSISIKALLSTGIDDINRKLKEISSQVATLASRSPGLGKV